MLFPLVPLQLRLASPTPGAPLYRDMPLIPLRISCNGLLEQGWAYVDTMSDIILLPASLANKLAIDLTTAPSRTVTVVGGSQVSVHYADVNLELRNPHGGVKWRATVAFGPTQRWLFGHFGGLEFFHFSLDSFNEEMMLVPRDNLPPVP